MEYATEQITSSATFQTSRNFRGTPGYQNHPNFPRENPRQPNQPILNQNNQPIAFRPSEREQRGANMSYNSNYQTRGRPSPENWEQQWSQPQSNQTGPRPITQRPASRQNYNQNFDHSNRNQQYSNPNYQNRTIQYPPNNYQQRGPLRRQPQNYYYNSSTADPNSYEEQNQWESPYQYNSTGHYYDDSFAGNGQNYEPSAEMSGNNYWRGRKDDGLDGSGNGGGRNLPQPRDRYGREGNNSYWGSQGPNGYQGNYRGPNRGQGNNRREDYSRQNPREGQRGRPYRQEPKKEITQQDLIDSLVKKQRVDIDNHKGIKIPPSITQTIPNSPYIVPSQQSHPVEVDLTLIESLAGPKQAKLANSSALLKEFFLFPQLQHMEEGQGVKGFKESTGIHFKQFERRGEQISAEILANFDINFRK